MSLRPRYSLLTLLLLTAAVAGGMKLWRGPHWAELHEPLTQEQKAFFEQHARLRDFVWSYGAEVVRYQFQRSLEGDTWQLIEGQTFTRPVLITLPPHQLVNGYPWAMTLRNGWQPIVFWIAGVAAQPADDSLYLLAEDRIVYRMALTPEEMLTPVPLAEIEHQAVRRRLDEELAKLPLKQAPEAAAR